MIAFLLSPLGRLAIAGAIGAAVGFGGAWKIQTGRLDTVKAEYNVFKGGVAALGEQAKANAARIEAENKLRKGVADAENDKTKRDLAGMYAAYRSLRDTRSPGGSLLPATPADSASPAVAAFDRTGLDRALSDFDQSVTGLIEQGDEAIADLNTAKRWATKE